jgi:hypothetical protein
MNMKLSGTFEFSGTPTARDLEDLQKAFTQPCPMPVLGKVFSLKVRVESASPGEPEVLRHGVEYFKRAGVHCPECGKKDGHRVVNVHNLGEFLFHTLECSCQCRFDVREARG